MSIIIRKIEQKDNAEVAALIRSVLIEHNVPKVGTAYADVSLDSMFETYSADKSAYFVVEDNGTLIGGAGIAPLENGPADVAELQKMYFLPQARGTGMGTKMMETCLAFAKQAGFERCYLETMTYMEAAQKLYRKSGFGYLNAPMGDTGHNSCPVWMITTLAGSDQ